MTKKDRISEGLKEIGAAWAVRSDRYCSPDDGMGAQVRKERMYHIHPVANAPAGPAILRFHTLDEIAGYIQARKESDAPFVALQVDFDKLTDREFDAWNTKWNAACVAADNIMGDFWASIER